MQKYLKLVVIGDKDGGKHEATFAYLIGEGTNGLYIPTVIDNIKVNKVYEGQNVCVQIWDTSGQEEIPNSRILAYPQSSVFILFFSLVKPITLKNIEEIWTLEIKENCPEIPFILVGTDSNLRDEYVNNLEKNEKEGLKPISTKEGEKFLKKSLVLYGMFLSKYV